MNKAIWPWATTLAASAATAAVAVASPVMALSVIVIALVLLLIFKTPDTIIFLTFASATITTPAFIPSSFSVASTTVRFYEVLLVFSVIYVLYRYPGRMPLAIYGFTALILLWAAFGLLVEHEPSKIIYDVRNLVMLLGAAVVALRVSSTDIPMRFLPWIKWVLWISAGFTLLASVGLLALSGRAEEAALPVSGSSGGDAAALRLLTPATYLALAVLCVMVALVVTRKGRMVDAAGFIAPAAALVFISFSRNSILGIGVATCFALMASRRIRSAIRTALYAVAVVIAFWILTVAAPIVDQLPGGNWLNMQISGFSERVLGGLTSDTLAVDNSAQFRFQMENNLIVPRIEEAPLLGHGFGFAYKLPTGLPGSFTADFAPYYAHNFYLWLLAKAGVLGLLLFVYFAVLPLFRLLNVRNHLGYAVGAATTAFLAISFVAPVPIGSPTALILGVLIGSCYGYIDRDAIAVAPQVEMTRTPPRPSNIPFRATPRRLHSSQRLAQTRLMRAPANHAPTGRVGAGPW